MEQNAFIEKLYVGLNQTQPNFSTDTNEKLRTRKGFRPKELKIEDPLARQCPNLQGKGLGTIIMQNWNTKNNLPKNIGNCLNLPVIVDRKKIQKHGLQTLYLPSTTPNNKNQRDHFGLGHIKEAGEKLLLGTQSNSSSKYSSLQSVTLSSFSSNNNNKSNVSHTSTGKNYYNKTSNSIKKREEKKTSYNGYNTALTTTDFHLTNNIADMANKMIVYQQQPSKKPKNRLTELINFETFNKHLYLQDNDFLYAIRKGGPVDFVLCTYQDINKSNAISKKSILANSKLKHNHVEYITISKNTILHYQHGQPTVYSIAEWVENYLKFKKLMSIPLFKNFKTAKLFELWRRFFKKTTRAYYTEKFKKKFQLIDKNLLKGIHEIRRILEQMENQNNIFSFEGLNNAVFSTTFKEIHQKNLQILDKKIENYRNEVKRELAKACNESYKAYKQQKKITLDDNDIINEEKKDEIKQKKKNNDGSINNFLKDAIPYAQDATRKTHYKKLLRYIRVIDYLFNESKFKLIRNSLNKLNMRFERLYSAYENGWSDSPLLIVTLFTMQDQIQYNPAMIALSDLIFDQFIQENIYTVVYKKSFIDPQEFPNYMICFEEVFENSVDQNSNLNNRIKEDPEIISMFNSIKEHFNKCKKALNDYSASLSPILLNYNKYDKIQFAQLEKKCTPDELKKLLSSFIEENDTVRKLKKVVNIGLFEFDISQLQEMVVDAPKRWLEKLRKVIPNVIINRLNNLIEILNKYIKNLSIPINNVESFIKLKKSVEECTKEKPKIEELNNEITDLLDIVYNDSRIKLEDYDSKLITELKNANVEFERKYDSMTYYIDNNIKQYRIDLKVKISKYDNEIKQMLSSLNEDQINKYSNDAGIPIMQLENQESSINQVIEKKKLYQQLEIDLDMDDAEKSNFENLDNLTYEYHLKCELWHSVGEFQKMAHSLDNYQVLNIDVKDTSEKIKKWNQLCQVALVDLDFPYVPQGLLENISSYEKVLPVLTAIQNKNVVDNDSIYEELKSLLGISYDVNNENFVLEKLMNLDNVYKAVDDIIQLNHRANEERKLKDLVAKKVDEFYVKRLLFKYRQNSDNKNDKFIFIDIKKEELDNEFEYCESNLLMLHQSLLNPSSYVVKKDINKLNNDIQRYMKFLYLYCDYQNLLRKSEGIIFNGEFAKEMPAELKKIINENQLKNLIKTLKDNYTLQRFLQENTYHKAYNSLTSLIESFEKNYKAISSYLDKKRREYPKYFALSDEDLINLYESKESIEMREKLIYKLYPWIKKIELTMNALETTGEEYLHIETIDLEKITIKVTKSSRTLRDIIDIIEFAIPRKLKDNFKAFKRDLDYSMRPKSEKKPKQVILDLISNNDVLSQNIFLNVYYAMMDNIEKALSLEDEAFDKLFDLYHENKDDYRELYISKAKDPKIDIRQRSIFLSLISLENVYILIIEKLIRDDVQRPSDYNFAKLLNPKIENDSFIFHIMSLSIEYGFDYTGHINNYSDNIHSDRFIVPMLHCFSQKKAFAVFGVNNWSVHYMLEEIAYKLIGRNVHRLICSEGFSEISLRNELFSSMKNGAWISVEKCECLSKEMFDLIAIRVNEVYRSIRESDEEGFFIENGEKIAVNYKNLNVFFVCDSLTEKNSQFIIRGYFKTISIANFDFDKFVEISLVNFAITDYANIAKKIIFALKYICVKSGILNGKYAEMQIFAMIIKKIRFDLYCELNKENENKIILNAILSCAKTFIAENELNDIHKVLLRIFLKDGEETETSSEEKESEKIELNEEENSLLTKIISKYHFADNSKFISKLKILFSSLSHFKSFMIIGSSLCGKSTLLHLLRNFTSALFTSNKSKYNRFLYMRIYPKETKTAMIFNGDVGANAKKKDSIFSEFLRNFSAQYSEILEKVNKFDSDEIEHQSSLIGGENDIFANTLTHIANSTNAKNNDDIDNEFAKLNISYDVSPSVINSIIFDDCAIDDKTLSFVTSLFTTENNFTLSNGEKVNFANYKLFFETCELKHLSPDTIISANIISLGDSQMKWDNIFYFYLETNKKANENAELKNYIRGLFENYFPKLYDFISSNKLKAISFDENYAINNLLTLFDALLPMFDFEDIKIGRKNLNAIPKIELIKKSTLSIFIFAFAWTALNLTNFVIKTKIEKLISDIFKADDLKGPVFDFFIDETTNEFEHWETLMNEENANVFGKKGEIFYYNRIFIPNAQNIPYTWILKKVLSSHNSIMLAGKPCVGKTSLVDYVINENANIKPIRYLTTPNATSYNIHNHLLANTNQIRRDIRGDEYGREIVFFIDDVHLSSFNELNLPEVHEYIRHFVNSKEIYDMNTNMMNFAYKLTVICAGNITAIPVSSYFNRMISRMYLLLEVISEENMLNVYKPTLEYHLRNYIPNTSSITAAQYLQVIIKLNNILSSELLQSPMRMHCLPSMWDVTKIVQAFHLFTFKGSSEYPEYLKKLFFYESTRVFSDRLNKKNDIEFFREKICEAYSSVFKQDKVSKDDIFAKWGSDDSYMFSNNYGSDDDAFNDNIYYANKSQFVEMIERKANEYNRNNRSYLHYDRVFLNDHNIDLLIKILRGMERDGKNMIILGKAYTCKSSIFKLACYIAKCNFIEVEGIYASKPQSAFIREVIESKLLVDVVYNNKKTFLLIHNEVLNSQFIIESINSLYNIPEIANNYNFINEEKYGSLTLTEIANKLRKNLSICLTVEPKSITYHNIFAKYPYIVKHSSIIFSKIINDDNIKSYYEIALKRTKCELNDDAAKSILKSMLSIHNFASELYCEYSSKLQITIKPNIYNFISMCEFYLRHFAEYKSILSSKFSKISSLFNAVSKCESTISTISSEIAKLTPLREQSEVRINDLKEQKRKLNVDRGQLKLKKQEEEKPISSLTKDKAEKKNILNDILTPILEKVEKSLKPIKDLQEKDIVEIKNTYENFPFGKFVFSKVYDVINSKGGISASSTSLIQVTTSNTEGNQFDWDTIKKTLNTKQIAKFASCKLSPDNSALFNAMNEICGHSEFGTDDKYQKPFRTCGLICEYFAQCKKYFDEYKSQNELICEIDKIKNDIAIHQNVLDDIIKQIKAIDKQIEDIDAELANCEKTKSNYANQIEKKNELLLITQNFLNLTNEKINIWNDKKAKINDLIENFNSYFIAISAYLSYAPPLSKNYRNAFIRFVYSSTKNANVTEYSFLDLFKNFLDFANKDKKLYIAMQNECEYIAENLIFISIRDNVTPIIIDPHRIAYDVLSAFIERKDAKSVVRIQNNNINIAETLERLEIAMKNGIYGFIDQCDDSFFTMINNVITNRTFADINDKAKKCCYINNKKFIRNENFKLFIIKQGKSNFAKDALINSQIINFSCTYECGKQIAIKSLAKEYDLQLYNAMIKAKVEYAKLIIRQTENENRIYNSLEKFDFTNNVDRLNANQITLENYNRDVLDNSQILNSIDSLKGKTYTICLNLDKYELIAQHSAKLYKSISKFFLPANISLINYDIFLIKVKEFFKKKCDDNDDAIKENEIKMLKKDKDDSNNEDNDDGIDDDLLSEVQGDEDNNENKETNNEENNIDNIKHKKTRSSIHHFKAQYKKTHLLELINYICESNLLSIFDHNLHIKTAVLFSLIIYYLKEMGLLPLEYKRIIKDIYTLCYLKKEKNIPNAKSPSPIETISESQWNILNYISDENSECLSHVIDSMINNKDKWTTLLSEDNENSFACKYYNIEYLKGCFASEPFAEQVTIFDIVVLFAIIKPHKAYECISNVINTQIDKNDIFAFNMLKLAFHNKSNKPLLLIENDHIYEKELRDYYFKELSANSSDVKYKEITLKGEITPTDLEIINSNIKIGGLIVIKNIHLANESLAKLNAMLIENKDSISEMFKLIFIVNEENCDYYINPLLLKICEVVNNSHLANWNFGFRSSCVDIIRILPHEIYETMLNRKNNLFARKIVVGFVFVHVFANYLQKFNKEVIKLNTNFTVKDLLYAIKFVNNYLANITEDKEQFYSNAENDFGINYMNVVNFAIENFYLSKLMLKNDINRTQRLFAKIFDEDKFFNENYLLYFSSTNSENGIISIENTIKNKQEIDENDLINLFISIPISSLSQLIATFSTMKKKEDYLSNSFSQIISYVFTSIYGKSEISKKEDTNIKVKVKKVYKLIYDFKMNFPEQIRTGEGISAISLFKLNKQGNFANPLDESLLCELSNINTSLSLLEKDIDNILSILRGEMTFADEYANMMLCISENKVPSQWLRITTANMQSTIAFGDWRQNLKAKVDYFNEWVTTGSVNIYHLPYFSNTKLFFANLRMFFCRRNADITPDSVNLQFEITSAKTANDLPKEEEANNEEDKTANITKQNNKVYISGIEIINAEYDGVLNMIEDNVYNDMPIMEVICGKEKEKKEEEKLKKDDIVIEEENSEEDDKKNNKDEENEEPIFKEEQSFKDEGSLLIPLYENKYKKNDVDNDNPLSMIEIAYNQKYNEEEFIIKGVKMFIKD